MLNRNILDNIKGLGDPKIDLRLQTSYVKSEYRSHQEMKILLLIFQGSILLQSNFQFTVLEGVEKEIASQISTGQEIVAHTQIKIDGI